MTYQNIHINSASPEDFAQGAHTTLYYIFLLQGDSHFWVDFNEYHSQGHSLLFLSPYQYFQWKEKAPKMDFIAFHGDFYCIEYHKKEVACNGLLFNNIYQQPHFEVSQAVFGELESLLKKMQAIASDSNPYQIAVLKSYLQLILAIGSREKQHFLSHLKEENPLQNPVANFQELLEANFLKEKDISFYAEAYHLSVSAFSKRIKQYYGKTPSALLRERLVLEAKKLLHLTHKSVKEIAFELCFEDAFYFSRYFKKEVGVSPKQFRESVGISIVAK